MYNEWVLHVEKASLHQLWDKPLEAWVKTHRNITKESPHSLQRRGTKVMRMSSITYEQGSDSACWKVYWQRWGEYEVQWDHQLQYLQSRSIWLKDNLLVEYVACSTGWTKWRTGRTIWVVRPEQSRDYSPQVCVCVFVCDVFAWVRVFVYAWVWGVFGCLCVGVCI